MSTETSAVERMMSVESIQDLQPEQALQFLGALIDLSLDLKRVEGAQRALYLAKEIDETSLSSEQRANLRYFVSNAWAHIRRSTRFGSDTVWDWEQEETEQEIINLRLALREPGFDCLPPERRCDIHTNLANVLDYVGRFVEALEEWDAALAIRPDFAMAQGNKGMGLWSYAKALYDNGEAAYLVWHAHDALERSLTSPLYPGAKEAFVAELANIKQHVKPDFLLGQPNVDGFSLGTSSEEINCRKWCLDNRLFLNPVNDLGSHAVAAEDALCVPPIVVSIEEGPHYPGFFNQLKQEYVSARYFLYLGLNSDELHHSDKNTYLVNTLDYPAYSLAAEQVKMAFRVAYSLLDKIAFFLNYYMNLGIREDRVTFRTFWYHQQKRDKGLRTELSCRNNWALRGLFWLSKDLYEDKPGFQDAIAPEAQQLRSIRNHLEHKYLKLHSDMWSGADDFVSPNYLKDALAFSLYQHDFESKTLTLLKMARAALIYMSLAVYREERLREEELIDSKVIVPLLMDTWEDEWKC